MTLNLSNWKTIQPKDHVALLSDGWIDLQSLAQLANQNGWNPVISMLDKNCFAPADISSIIHFLNFPYSICGVGIAAFEANKRRVSFRAFQSEYAKLNNILLANGVQSIPANPQHQCNAFATLSNGMPSIKRRIFALYELAAMTKKTAPANIDQLIQIEISFWSKKAKRHPFLSYCSIQCLNERIAYFYGNGNHSSSSCFSKALKIGNGAQMLLSKKSKFTKTRGALLLSYNGISDTKNIFEWLVLADSFASQSNQVQRNAFITRDKALIESWLTFLEP